MRSRAQAQAPWCPLCGEEVAKGGFREHRSAAHAGIRDAAQGLLRRVVVFTIPAAATLIVAVCYLLVADVNSTLSWIAIGVLLYTAYVAMVALASSGSLRRAYAETPFRCFFCDSRVPRKDLPQHILKEHPGRSEIARLLRFPGYLATGAIAGIGVLVILATADMYIAVAEAGTGGPLFRAIYITSGVIALVLALALGVAGSTWYRVVARARADRTLDP